MFRNNYKRSNNCICIICLVFCIIFLNIKTTFATQFQVVDAPANQKLQNIYNTLYTTYAEITAQTDHLRAIKVALQNGGDTYNIISAVGGQVADVSSKLITTNNYLSSINGSVDGVESSLTSLINNTDTLEELLGNPTWSTINTTYDYSYCVSNTYLDYKDVIYDQTADNITVPANSYIYLKFQTNIISPGTPIVRYILNFRGQAVSLCNVMGIYAYRNNVFTDLNDALFIGGGSNSYLYVFYPDEDGMFPYTFFIVLKTANTDTQLRTNGTSSLQYIQDEAFNKKSTTEFLQFLYSIQNNKNIQKLTNIYASDDVIQAKQNQQNFESQAITDFTGNGNNSASLNDLGSVSNISSTVKNGLNAGGSISGGLSVFDSNNSDFWGWFSQSNYNEINGVQNRRILNHNEYYDYVTDNQNELERLLNKYD